MTVGRRPLGSTGVDVSMVGLGGFHLGIPGEDEAVRMVHEALDAGIDFIDDSWDYHGGRSEERVGKALQGRRDQAFVMTKVDGQTKEAARAQLEDSLRRLRTDVIDLWQFHEVIRMEDADSIFRLGGIEAAIEARDRGEVRFLGFTGHKDPHVHLHMLDVADREGFRFDTVQMPLNAMDAHYHSFQLRVLPVLVEKGMGVLGMKPLGSGHLLESGVTTAEECLRYALSLPTSVVITGCEDIAQVRQAARVATDFEPMTPGEVRDLLERTAPLAGEGRFETYKTTNTHDGTARNRQWLGV